MDVRILHEIEHGRYLATHGAGEIWNWEGPAGRLRWQRRVSLLTANIRHGMKVLELGCGTAYFTRELAKTGACIEAIDISPDLLRAAQRNCPAENVSFHEQNAYALTYPENRFDAVVGSSVLHHLELDQAIHEIYRVLRPTGTVAFTEPNMLNPQIAVQKNVPAIKRHMGDSPDETAFFRWPLHRILQQAGFREVKITPFDFLHPKTPRPMIALLQKLDRSAEKIPLLREIAGSLYIRAVK